MDPGSLEMQAPISETLVLAGVLLMGYGFIMIPSINEAIAVAFIKELYLTTIDGRIILSKHFKMKVKNENDDVQEKLFDE
nr:hypothetical protein [Candidatus Sigynarchaeota archaeon]